MQQASRPIGVILIIAFHLLSLVLWAFGQTLAVVDYELVASWGLQDPPALIDPAIMAVNRAIGLADTLVMLPLHAAAAAGLFRMRFWGAVASWMVFGMTLYWPLVFWASQGFYDAGGIRHAPTAAEAIILPGALWLVAAWGSWYLARIRAQFG